MKLFNNLKFHKLILKNIFHTSYFYLTLSNEFSLSKIEFSTILVNILAGVSTGSRQQIFRKSICHYLFRKILGKVTKFYLNGFAVVVILNKI